MLRIVLILLFALPVSLQACPPEAKTRLAYHLSLAKQLYSKKDHSFHILLPLAIYEKDQSQPFDLSHLNNPILHWRMEKDFFISAGFSIPLFVHTNEKEYNYSPQVTGSAGYAWEKGIFSFRHGAEFLNTRHDMFFGDFTALTIPPTWTVDENYKINVITNLLVRRKTFSNLDPHKEGRNQADLNVRLGIEAKIRQISFIANSVFTLQKEATLSSPDRTFSLGLVYNL